MGKKDKSEVRSTMVSLAAFVVVIAGVMASASIITPFLLALFIAIISLHPFYGFTIRDLITPLP